MALFVQVRIDHRNGTVHFGGQQLESDRIRDHISALARRLTKALHMVEPEVSKEVEARRLKVSEMVLLVCCTSHWPCKQAPSQLFCSLTESTSKFTWCEALQFKLTLDTSLALCSAGSFKLALDRSLALCGAGMLWQAIFQSLRLLCLLSWHPATDSSG